MLWAVDFVLVLSNGALAAVWSGAGLGLFVWCQKSEPLLIAGLRSAFIQGHTLQPALLLFLVYLSGPEKIGIRAVGSWRSLGTGSLAGTGGKAVAAKRERR